MANKIDLGTSLIATAPSPATTGTTLVVTAGQGVRFPTAPFYATAHPEGTLPTLDTAEIVQVTDVTTDTLTIVRHQKGTSAKSIAIGWRISNSVYASDFTDVLKAIYPVGSVYTNSADNTNPGTLLGFGTWVAFAAGKVPVGIDAAQTEFASLGQTGGSKVHKHMGYGDSNAGMAGGDLRAQIGATLGDANRIGYIAIGAANPNGSAIANWTYSFVGTSQSANGSAWNHHTPVVGFTAEESTLQPYITVYMWTRTA